MQTQTGIIYGADFDEYKSWPHMNASTLLWGKVSMQHLQAAIAGKLSKESTALTFGRALHCRLLEPEQYEFRFSIAEPCCATLKTGPNKGKPCNANGIARSGNGWLCGKHRMEEAIEEECITRCEAAQIEAIAESLKNHAVVKLLRQHGGCEASAVWEREGVTCKARFDKLILKGNCPPAIVDVKKVRAGYGTQDRFRRHIFDYDYHVRAAMYVNAIEAIEGIRPLFIWVVVEDSCPHAVGVYKCDDITLQAGRVEFLNLLNAYKTCMETQEWPGYTTDIEDCGLPEWETRKWEKLLG